MRATRLSLFLPSLNLMATCTSYRMVFP
uniref:Uncharacterized protein n=1 Tax=Arundo donax TaxID=35708 RepID=A0A0A9F8V7_ARUDO